MKRRDFLKGMTAASVAVMASELAFAKLNAGRAQTAALAGSAAPANSTFYLNIFVHGMFAIVVDIEGYRYKKGPKVKLLAPRVVSNSGGVTVKHRYFAKIFKPGTSNVLNETYSYEIVNANTIDSGVAFTGVKPNASSYNPLNDDSTRIVIKVGQTSDVPGKPAWTVDLPAIPTDICQLRAAHFNYFDPNGLTYQGNQLTPGQWFPVVNVIRYEFSAQPTVTFNPGIGSNTGTIDFVDGIGRLHLFAEPDMNPHCVNNQDPHLQDAIDEFDKLFDQNLNLHLMDMAQCVTVYPDPIPNTCNRSGILVCEERGLSELAQDCSVFENKKKSKAQEQYKKDEERLLKNWKRFVEREQKKTPGVLLSRSALSQLAKKFTRTNGGKPPSNCMSIVCFHPGKN